MNTAVDVAPAPSADLAGLEPLRVIRSRWPVVIGVALTAAMIWGLGRALLGSGLAGLAREMPADPRFYLTFAALYMSLPTGDFIIFHRLWGIPASGLVALIKKRIANEVVLGYSGEAYFYAWARARAKMVAAPFGAVKDVSILSAIAGNAITLAMIVAAAPFGARMLSGAEMHKLLVSTALIFAMSLPWLIFSRRVFTLPRARLWWIFGVHCLRLVAGSVLIALAWHWALPAVPVAMWLLLAAARLLVSRLPLLPNKDLIFANVAVLLIGRGQALSALVALTAALTLLVHVVLIGAFSLYGVVTRTSSWRN